MPHKKPPRLTTYQAGLLRAYLDGPDALSKEDQAEGLALMESLQIRPARQAERDDLRITVLPERLPLPTAGERARTLRPPAPGPRLAPERPGPSLGDSATSMAISAVPAVAGQWAGGALGGPLAPATMAVGGFVGGGIGEFGRQLYNRDDSVVSKDEINWPQVWTQASLSAIPGLGGPAATPLRRVAQGTGTGALMAPVATVATNWADDRPLTENIGLNTILGAGFGAGAAGTFEGIRTAAPYMRRGYTEAASTMGEFLDANPRFRSETGAVGLDVTAPPAAGGGRVPGAPEPGQLPIQHGRVERELDQLFRDTPNPTPEDLARMPGAPRPRRGKEGGLDRDVRPTGWAEYKAMVLRGLQYVGFYDKFADGAGVLVGRDRMPEFAGVFHLTSAQNSVETNFADTLAIMRQASTPAKRNPLLALDLDAASRGLAKSAPAEEQAATKAFGNWFRAQFRRQNGKGIKVTNEQAIGIARLYQTGETLGGLKTNTYGNTIVASGRGDYMPWTVQDVHAARTKGYRYRALSDEGEIDDTRIPSQLAYRYAQYLDLKMSQELGVSPQQVQEAAWFVGKQELSAKAAEQQKHLVGRPDIVPGSWESAQIFAADEIQALGPALGPLRIPVGDTPYIGTVSRQGMTGESAAVHVQDPGRLRDLGEHAYREGGNVVISTKPGSSIIAPVGTTVEEFDDFTRVLAPLIMDDRGHLNALRALGINAEVTQRYGTWNGVEPNFNIRMVAQNENATKFAASLLGSGLMQDAVVYSRPQITDGALGVRISHPSGQPWSLPEIKQAAATVNPSGGADGVNFSVSNDGKTLEFLYFGDEAGMLSWYDEIKPLGPSTRFAVKGNLLEAKEYGSVIQQYWRTYGAARRSDIPERFVDDLLRQPYLETAAQFGWTFDPARYARSTGRSAGEAVAVIPSGTIGSFLRQPVNLGKHPPAPTGAAPPGGYPSYVRPRPNTSLGAQLPQP
jgi:hypothetical protein